MSSNEVQYGREVSSVMQREQERERRRMRDRQRRESMTTEERENHLARRRRNYQLRRQRAGNAQSGSDGDQAFLSPGREPRGIMNASAFGVGQSSGCNKEFGRKLKGLDVEGVGHGCDKLSIFKGKLRSSQFRLFARSLDGFQRKLMSAYVFSNINLTSYCESGRRLRLTQVKCLAREINSNMKDVTDHLRRFPARSLSNGPETSLSEEVSHYCSDLSNTAELDNISNHGEQPMLTEVNIKVASTQ